MLHEASATNELVSTCGATLHIAAGMMKTVFLHIAVVASFLLCMRHGGHDSPVRKLNLRIA